MFVQIKRFGTIKNFDFFKNLNCFNNVKHIKKHFQDNTIQYYALRSKRKIWFSLECNEITSIPYATSTFKVIFYGHLEVCVTLQRWIPEYHSMQQQNIKNNHQSKVQRRKK
jgi:hypothetical protein